MRKRIPLIENGAGYTLVELLAVVTILVILAGIISGIIFSTLRGSNKTRITTEISQNGNYVLGVLSNIISSSTSVTKISGQEISDCTASPFGSSITLRNGDGTETTISCSAGNIQSGSTPLINTGEVRVKDNSCKFTCSQKSSDPYSIPLIDIEFTLEDQNAILFENKASSLFKTSVSIRNFAP